MNKNMIAEGTTMGATTYSHKEHTTAVAPFHSHFFESLHKEQWQEVRLGEIAEIKTGKGNVQDSVNDGVYPFFDRSQKIKKSHKFIFDSEAIIVAGEGKDFIPRYYKGRFDLHQRCYAIFNVMQNAKYIYYAIYNQKDVFKSIAVGSTVMSLRLNHFTDFTIPLPPLKVQQQIAEILSSFDDKIDLLHGQNKTLESLALTLFRHYTTNKELDSVIGDIVSLQAGFAFKSKDFQNFGNNKIIKIKNIQNSIIDILNTDFVGENIVNSLDNKFKILSGDILFGMTGAEIGKMGIVPQNNNSLWLNQRVGVLREKVGNTKFLAYLQLTSEIGFDYIINAASGSAQPNISAKDIENCPFYSLSTKELFSLSLQIKPLFDKIIQNLGIILSLQQMRDMLLSEILNDKMGV